MNRRNELLVNKSFQSDLVPNLINKPVRTSSKVFNSCFYFKHIKFCRKLTLFYNCLKTFKSLK